MGKVSRTMILVLGGTLLLGFSGCSKKAANESNFRSAINHSLSRNPLCVGNYISNRFPLMQGDDPFLDAMVSKGLASKNAVDAGRFKYDVTAAGRATSMHYTGNALVPSNDYYFCYGTRAVDKITNYTEPSNFMGQTVVNVSYTWKLSQPLPSWAADPSVMVGVAANDRQLKSFQNGSGNAEERKGSAALVQTHNGWRASGDTDH